MIENTKTGWFPGYYVNDRFHLSDETKEHIIGLLGDAAVNPVEQVCQEFLGLREHCDNKPRNKERKAKLAELHDCAEQMRVISPLKKFKFRQTAAATDSRMKSPSFSKKTSA